MWCVHYLQASKTAFREFIQVDADTVWLILSDTFCPQSPIHHSTANGLPPVHVTTTTTTATPTTTSTTTTTTTTILNEMNLNCM